jgi:formyl-CoA transferase
LDLVRIGARIDGQHPGVAAPPPQLGEHTEDILQSLGYSAETIAAMRAEGVI